MVAGVGLDSTKICTKCNLTRSLDDFYNSSSIHGGKRARCKECTLGDNKKWAEKNWEKVREKACRYEKNHPDRVRKRKRKWREANLERAKETSLRWRKNNPEKIREYGLRNSKNRHMKNKDDPKYKINKAIGSHIYASLKGRKNGRSWEGLTGYTLNELIKHLENLFEQEMSWNNYGDWHVDHKVPISAFNFSEPEQIDFKKCWALSNLQPLWAKENMRKNNILEKPFQPSLGF